MSFHRVKSRSMKFHTDWTCIGSLSFANWWEFNLVRTIRPCYLQFLDQLYQSLYLHRVVPYLDLQFFSDKMSNKQTTYSMHLRRKYQSICICILLIFACCLWNVNDLHFNSIHITHYTLDHSVYIYRTISYLIEQINSQKLTVISVLYYFYTFLRKSFLSSYRAYSSTCFSSAQLFSFFLTFCVSVVYHYRFSGIFQFRPRTDKRLHSLTNTPLIHGAWLGTRKFRVDSLSTDYSTSSCYYMGERARRYSSDHYQFSSSALDRGISYKRV